MKNKSLTMKWIILFLVVSLCLYSCGVSDAQPMGDEISDQIEDPTEEYSSEDSAMEMNTSGAEFEEGELPEDFPEAFPIPEETKIGSSIEMPGENNFRIFLAYLQAMDEVLAYYHQELPTRGWTIESEETSSQGVLLKITNPEYEAKLDFITSEMGTVLDLTIEPLGQAVELPGSDQTFGESESLGESEGDFPADFPVPNGASAIPLSDKLAGEGYQLAFSFGDLPEMAMIQLSTSLMSNGWEIGDMTVEAATHVYLVPFSDPGSGFLGYAMLTDNPDLLGMDSVDGSVIALHPGNP